MTIPLSIVAALAFGFGMTLQQRGARTIPFDQALKASMVGRLLHRRVWLAGVGLSGFGFLVQLLALRDGSLVTVQPIVTSALVVCLAMTAWLDGAPLTRRTWGAIGVVVVGVVVFLEAGTAHRTAATTTVDVVPMVAAGLVFVGLVVVCVNRARSGIGTGRAVAVGLAAGLGNAYVALLGRGGADTLNHGVGAVLKSGYPYVLLATAVVTVLLVQAIYQAGRPTLSLPLATMTEATGSVVLAIGVLHEHPILTGTRGAVALLGFLAAVGGLADLSRDDARAFVAQAPAATST